MKIVIDDFGAYLKKKGKRLVVISGEKMEEFPAEKVEQVMILKGSAISTDAIELASRLGIDIVCLDRVGRPYARVYPCRLGGTTLTRRNQLEAYFSKKGVRLSKSFVRAKIQNMGHLLKALAKSRDNKTLYDSSRYILGQSDRIKEVNEGSTGRARNVLMGIEGEVSKVYFSALRQVLSEDIYSGLRSKRPPGDIFNAFLSYGYGILYSEVERACIISGLDPYLGFLHTDRYGKPSMVLDLIEEFRQPIVDRAMITIAVRGQVGEADVDMGDGGNVLLNKNGRKKAIEALMSRLGTTIRYRGKNIAFKDVMLGQARGVVRFLNENTAYKPFIHRW